MALICERCFNPIRGGELYLRQSRVRYQTSDDRFDQVYVYRHADLADLSAPCPVPTGGPPGDDGFQPGWDHGGEHGRERDQEPATVAVPPPGPIPLRPAPRPAAPRHQPVSWRQWPRGDLLR